LKNEGLPPDDWQNYNVFVQLFDSFNFLDENIIFTIATVCIGIGIHGNE